MARHIASAALTPLVQGLAFPEGPRWHDGALWCADIADGRVLRIGSDGAVDVVVDGIPGVSGLGWLPDGRMLAVAGEQRALLRQASSGWQLHADLAPLVPADCNDMVVDAQGRAWVGNWGFDFLADARPATTVIVRVDPDGRAQAVADGMFFPNGSVVTPDGRTLIVAETYRGQLTAFDIADDGTLSPRRAWAALAEAKPDGICLDAEGAIWLASPPTRQVLRVREGGEITHRVDVPGDAVACMLGGTDRRTLFTLSVPLFAAAGSAHRFNDKATLRAVRGGRIDRMQVDVPGAGWP
jgi:sugar lactone lactonase YvrE